MGAVVSSTVNRGGGTVAVVVIGGGPLSPRAVEMWNDLAESGAPTLVIAADSGLDHAVAAGLRPDRLVGDLDSISAAGRMWAYANGVDIDEHPVAKDETDTELALAVAVADPAVASVIVLGGLDPAADDRLDHLLGTLLVLGHPSLSGLESVGAVLGGSEVVVVHPGNTTVLPLAAGQVFSLLALHGPCDGVNVTGAHWPLQHATITGYEARGVSNVSNGDTTVAVAHGTLTVVMP